MKVIFNLLIVGFLLSTTVIFADGPQKHKTSIYGSEYDGEQGESSLAGSWYDQADEILELVAPLPESLYADSVAFHQWSQLLFSFINQLILHGQLQAELLQQVQLALESSTEKIKALEAERSVFLNRLSSCVSTMEECKSARDDASENIEGVLTIAYQAALPDSGPRL